MRGAPPVHHRPLKTLRQAVSNRPRRRLGSNSSQTCAVQRCDQQFVLIWVVRRLVSCSGAPD
eukprot:9017398-Lingulodinium_polyedra.AAC.1